MCAARPVSGPRNNNYVFEIPVFFCLPRAVLHGPFCLSSPQSWRKNVPSKTTWSKGSKTQKLFWPKSAQTVQRNKWITKPAKIQSPKNNFFSFSKTTNTHFIWIICLCAIYVNLTGYVLIISFFNFLVRIKNASEVTDIITISIYVNVRHLGIEHIF